MSTSRSRTWPGSVSAAGTIYESNSILFWALSFQKSEYSYLQYHWCPTTFTLRQQEMDSSSMYRSSREGTAICSRITAGIMVQIHSSTWPSSS